MGMNSRQGDSLLSIMKTTAFGLQSPDRSAAPVVSRMGSNHRCLDVGQKSSPLDHNINRNVDTGLWSLEVDNWRESLKMLY